MGRAVLFASEREGFRFSLRGWPVASQTSTGFARRTQSREWPLVASEHCRPARLGGVFVSAGRGHGWGQPGKREAVRVGFGRCRATVARDRLLVWGRVPDGAE